MDEMTAENNLVDLYAEYQKKIGQEFKNVQIIKIKINDDELLEALGVREIKMQIVPLVC